VHLTQTGGLHTQSAIILEQYNWNNLLKRDGDELFDQCRHILENLEKVKGYYG